MKRITAALLRGWPLPALDAARGKAARGHVFVVGGSDEVPGAVQLAVIAALRVGAGTATVATSRACAAALATSVPEVRVIGVRGSRRGLAGAACAGLAGDAKECEAIVVGPGMTDPRGGIALLERCARGATSATFVVDAASIQAFAKRACSRPTILTPHPGEMAALAGVDVDEVLADPAAIAVAQAKRTGAVVALKGEVTHVAHPDGRVYRNDAGNLGLGTAGSGDVLAGIIGGLCARGAEPLQAAVWGVHLHARAGDALAKRIGPLGYLASELLPELPRVLASV